MNLPGTFRTWAARVRALWTVPPADTARDGRERNGREKARLFCGNLLVGVVVMALVLVSVAATRRHGVGGESLAELEAPVQDLLMLLIDPPDMPENFPPVLFIDVDERTWRDERWGGGEPKTVPLDRLAELIDRAEELGAKYILVDFVVEDPEDPEKMTAFRETVEKIARRTAGREERDRRHFLFVRNVRYPIPPRDAPDRRSCDHEAPCRLRPSTALDQLMADLPDQVHAVSPKFVNTDQTVRHWRLWERVVLRLPEQPDGNPGGEFWAVLPSPQLLIRALETGDPIPWTPESLFDAKARKAGPPVSPPAAKPCGPIEADFKAGWWIRESYCEQKRFCDRCSYQDSFTPEDCKAGARPACERREPPAGPLSSQVNRVFFPWNGGEGDADRHLYRVSARDLLSAEPGGRVEAAAQELPEGFKEDKKAVETGTRPYIVAIIGASYEASGDFHNTWWGEMPGALLIANGLATMRLHGPLREVGPWLNVLLLVVMLALFSAAFVWAPGGRLVTALGDLFVALGEKVRAWGGCRSFGRPVRGVGTLIRGIGLEMREPPWPQLPAVLLVILFFLALTGFMLAVFKTWFNFTVAISFICILMKMKEGKLWLVTALLALLLLIR